jgi:predicted negative regulator of RcsB-dependent stress response
VTTHYDEEAQVEQLRKWLHENWFPLASGLALGLAVIFGWQGWGAHQDARAGAAAHLFDDLGQAAEADKFDDAKAMADRLAQEYSDTPYAAAGALKLGQLAVQDNKLDEAVTRLQWVVDFEQHRGLLARLAAQLRLRQGAYDVALLPLAKVRLAQVLWQQNKPDEALKQLDGDAGAYASEFAELRGDIKLAQGDRAGARGAYEQSLQSLGAADAPGRQSGLQRKIDDLADAATVKS